MKRRLGVKQVISYDDVLTMSGYLFTEYEDEAMRDGIAKLATALLLPTIDDSANLAEVENLVRIAIEAYQ